MLTVIVPSRGRPEAALRLVNAVADTRQIHNTRLVFAVDHSDDMAPMYKEVAATRPDVAHVEMVQGGWMVAALNEAALRIVSSRLVEAVGFFGDDHLPRTHGWDAAYLTALRKMGAGIVYGDDLLQHEFVPTQCAMSADIIRRLGWMAHPSLRHMYVDTLWRDMARPVGKLQYLPDVVIEHLHYLNNKAAMDPGYERVNAPEIFKIDEEAFRQLHATGVVRSASEVIHQLSMIKS